MLLAGVVITLLLLFAPSIKTTPTKALNFSSFLAQAKAHKIKTASINPTGAVTGAGFERSRPQCLQTMASSWISSAQNGHFFTALSCRRCL